MEQVLFTPQEASLLAAKDGLYAKRQLSRGYDKSFWISDAGSRLDSAHVNAALGDAIARLK
jgi:hypothetical protein